MARLRRIRDLPKSLLNALDIVLEPVALGHVLLADGHSLPGNTHDGNVVDVILVKLDVQLRVVTGGPLVETPALCDLLGGLEFEIFARHVAVKQLKLSAELGTLEDLGRRSGKGSNSLRVDKGLVQLLSRGAELFVIGHGRRVHGATGLYSLGGRSGLGGGGGLGVDFGGRETARGVGARGVLDILAMLGDEGAGKLLELLSQLGHNLGADEVLHGLLLLGVGKDVYVKLRGA